MAGLGALGEEAGLLGFLPLLRRTLDGGGGSVGYRGSGSERFPGRPQRLVAPLFGKGKNLGRPPGGGVLRAGAGVRFSEI